jgi:hypothetical protein
VEWDDAFVSDQEKPTMSDENITVGSAHVDLGSGFREHAQQKILHVTKKYLGDLTMASVHVAQEGTRYRCSVNMQMGGQPVMSGGQSRRGPSRFPYRLEQGRETAAADKARAARGQGEQAG